MDPRLAELLARVCGARGPIAGALSASEWHELRDECDAFRARALTTDEREDLRFALKFLDTREWLVHQRHDPNVAAHIQRCERAVAAITKFLGTEPETST